MFQVSCLVKELSRKVNRALTINEKLKISREIFFFFVDPGQPI